MEGKEKPMRESEGKKGEVGSASEARSIRQSRDPIKEKAHLKQQALWGIVRSSAPLHIRPKVNMKTYSTRRQNITLLLS